MLSIKHVNCDPVFKRGTIVLELPSKQFLEDSLFKTHGTSMLMEVGVARLAPKKEFNKKLGVKYAKENVKLEVLRLVSVDIRPAVNDKTNPKHVYKFELTTICKCPKEPTQRLEFGVSTTAESNTVQLLWANWL